MEIYKTDGELKEAIKRTCPELTDAGQSLLRYDVILRSMGLSLEKVIDGMTVEGSPFLKLSSRE